MANDLEPADDEAIPLILDRNLRRLRTRQGLSLERLARVSGVSRAMLGQIELGRSAPTITLLWKIARALDVSIAALTSTSTSTSAQDSVVVLRQAQAKILSTADGLVLTRPLFPGDGDRRVEFREMLLHPQATEDRTPHPAGTVEHLVVAMGRVEVTVGGARHRLERRDAILFDADVPHAVRNVGDGDALLYLVLSHGESDR
ncbi:helix-turn-helix domain-containing protein [Azospirillum agricola]|uniref:helix-turn-helix domain-containing protein n=1 Tax=Azospirillum agricola TaxID=1720247 RepID=UPI001CBDEFE6|nr:helix-turn-helix domain-containing protein [Azospirillum agricola]